MRELIGQIRQWQSQGKSVALATVVKAWGSSPRPLGSKMAVSSAGEMAGSVSGGCVEGAVVEQALAVLAGGEPELVEYGVSDDLAWSVGLSCGGKLGVFIDQTSKKQLLDELARRLEAEETVALATVLAGPAAGQALFDAGGIIAGGFDSAALAAAATVSAASYLTEFRSGREEIRIGDERYDLFFEAYPPPPKMIVIGAVHVAIHLTAFGKRLGYRTIVIDPRTAFATPDRFAEADELRIEWPAEALAKIRITDNTYFALLAHDLKIDLPALEVALRSPARYIGALGSKKTHSKRVVALEELGFSGTEIARIRNPIGLDLGGRRAEEMALAILAEMLAARHGRF